MNNYSLKVGLLTLLSPDIKGIGPAYVKKNISSKHYFDQNIVASIVKLFQETKKEISDEAIYEASEVAKNIITECQDEDIKILTVFDSEYPIKIKSTNDAPPILFVKGNIELIEQLTICIIGTRDANINGIKITEKVSEYYRSKKWNIANGLAEGIDSAAIRILDNYYSRVVGVVAGGLNFNTNKTLLKKTSVNAQGVLDAGGVIVSEYPPGKKEDSFTVIKSCKLQAMISNGLILIQSSVEGGSRHTLKSYCETGRPFAFIKPLPGDENLESYSANKILTENPMVGLSKITGLKSEKIVTRKAISLSSKADYAIFDEALLTNDKKKSVPKTLFEE
jgi:DNA processing protein